VWNLSRKRDANESYEKRKSAASRSLQQHRMSSHGQGAAAVYIGRSDVTVIYGHHTISILYGMMSYRAKLTGETENFSRYLNKTESVDLRKLSTNAICCLMFTFPCPTSWRLETAGVDGNKEITRHCNPMHIIVSFTCLSVTYKIL